MPTWSPQWKVRRANRILSFAVRQNWELLNTGGEVCYLLKRLARANSTFQLEARKVETLTKNVPADSYTIDPDTGKLRYRIWHEGVDADSSYPDIGTLTVTVQTSGNAEVWEAAVDKYSFISNYKEYAIDIFQDQLDSDGVGIPDSMYVVFNTPPFASSATVMFTYGNINPLVSFESMQPVRDNRESYQQSLFGFEQWMNPNSKVRSRSSPNAFLLAFPGVKSDFTITEGGLLREVRGDFWTTPMPYSPVIVEHDVVIRESTCQRFQVVDYTPIYIENILVSQHFNMVELDPRSSIYNISYDDGMVGA